MLAARFALSDADLKLLDETLLNERTQRSVRLSYVNGVRVGGHARDVRV